AETRRRWRSTRARIRAIWIRRGARLSARDPDDEPRHTDRRDREARRLQAAALVEPVATAEPPYRRQHERQHGQLTRLDADVERGECVRQLRRRKGDLAKRAGE